MVPLFAFNNHSEEYEASNASLTLLSSSFPWGIPGHLAATEAQITHTQAHAMDLWIMVIHIPITLRLGNWDHSHTYTNHIEGVKY